MVEAAGSGPGNGVQLTFPHVEGANRVQGHVPVELWRAPEAQDVAFIRLSSMPAGARTLPLGSAEGCRGHQVRSFGFPAQAPPEGHFGFGVAGDLLPGSRGRSAHLQLTSANDLTTGFSGGPPVRDVLFTRPLEAIQKICRTVKRDFTPDERKTYLPHDSGRVCPTSDGGS
ncbi:serine protease [Streptomyces sp. G1]|nr:serine protease [Streptomyces sp. G1]